MEFFTKITGLKLNNKKGFTLAEVLITLAVIGVVAAITIPAVINKIEEQRAKSLVKKTVSTLVNANKMARANYDYEEDEFVDCVIPKTETLNDRKSMCSLINTYVKGAKYISLSGYSTTNYYYFKSVNLKAAYQLPSGVIVFLDANEPTKFYIDINGKKGPNKTTRGTQNGFTSISYSGDSNRYGTIDWSGKPEKFYDVYVYNMKRNLIFEYVEERIAFVSLIVWQDYGATLWMLNH